MVSTIRHSLILILLLLQGTVAWAQLDSQVDRKTLDSNETLQLIVRYQGQVLSSEPDFSALKSDFDILSSNRSQKLTSINGVTESYTDWNLTLLPKREGKLLIPSFKFKGHISSAIEIDVRKAQAGSAPGQPVYAEAGIDKNSVYQQEQLLLTLRLYTSVQLSDLTISELDISDTETLKVSENQYQKRIGNSNYLVVEIKYALFPQTAGMLKIPSQRFTAYQSSRYGFGRGNRVIRDTEPLEVDVAPRPAQIAANQWMPAGGVSLSQEWSQDVNNLVVGEPVTRTLRIAAQGLMGAQIVPLALGSDDSSYKLYPDQPQIDQRSNASGVLGTRVESVALVPNRSGEITLPAVTVRWWNSARQRIESTSIAEQTLQVKPAAAGSTEPADIALPAPLPAEPATPPASGEYSALLKGSLSLNALLLAVLIGLLLRRLRITPTAQPTAPDNSEPSLKEAYQALDRAASQADLPALRKAVLYWAQAMFPDTPIQRLEQIHAKLDDDQLNTRLAELDRQLYHSADASAFDCAGLVNCLKKHKKSLRNRGDRSSALPPLYPRQTR